MKNLFSWKRLIKRAPIIALVAVAATAGAQFVVDGQQVGSNSGSATADSGNSTSASGDAALQTWVGLNELEDYDPGPYGDGGEALSVAIATFQIRNNMAVTGEVSDELAQAIAAAVRAQNGNAPSSMAASASESANADNPCIQREAVETASKANRFARIARAGERLFNRAGGDSDIARDVSGVANDASAVARDVAIVSPDC